LNANGASQLAEEHVCLRVCNHDHGHSSSGERLSKDEMSVLSKDSLLNLMPGV